MARESGTKALRRPASLPKLNRATSATSTENRRRVGAGSTNSATGIPSSTSATTARPSHGAHLLLRRPARTGRCVVAGLEDSGALGDADSRESPLGRHQASAEIDEVPAPVAPWMFRGGRPRTHEEIPAPPRAFREDRLQNHKHSVNSPSAQFPGRIHPGRHLGLKDDFQTR